MINMPQEKWSDYASPTGPDTRQADKHGWLPIESAPRDGTDVLVARYDPDGSDWYAVAQWWVEEFAFMGGDSRQSRHPILLCFTPTHWQPLPAPPEDES